jgi:hypothetical protein
LHVSRSFHFSDKYIINAKKTLITPAHAIAEERAGRSAKAGRDRVAITDLIAQDAADYAAGQALMRAAIIRWLGVIGGWRRRIIVRGRLRVIMIHLGAGIIACRVMPMVVAMTMSMSMMMAAAAPVIMIGIGQGGIHAGRQQCRD